MMAITITKITTESGGRYRKPTRSEIQGLKIAIRNLMSDLRFRGLIDGRG